MTTDAWPLFGRSGELERVSALLHDGDQAGVVLAGSAGVGKTRLACECLTMARTMSYAVTRITATASAAGMPLGAFGPLLPAPCRADASPTGISALLGHVRRAIAGGSLGGRLALLVDDAHLLDDESAVLVHQLATTRAAVVIATMRSGTAAPDPLVALWKDETLARIDLEPLAPPVIEDLLVAVLGGPVDGATRHFLAARTRGNVQLLRELVLAAVEAEVLRDEGGVWRLVATPPASPRLVELVESGLQSLSDEERTVVETVACGEPLGMAVLAQLVDARHVEALERRGLVTVGRDGRRREASLTYPVHGDVVRTRMPAVRSEALRQALAAAFETVGMNRRHDVLRVVGWRLEGGGQIPATLATAAADRAHLVGDTDLAARLAEAAVEADGGFDAALLAGWLAGLRGHGELAERRLEALVPVARSDARRAVVAVARADNLLMHCGRPEQALAVLAEAEAGVSGLAWRDELHSKRAYALFSLGARAKATAVAARVVSRATGSALSEACVVLALAHAHAGRTGAALRACRLGEGAASRPPGVPVYWPEWIHGWTRCESLLVAGKLAPAEEEARRQYDRAVAGGCRTAQAAFACALNRVTLRQGRALTAAGWGREAVSLLRGASPQFALRWALADLAWALALGGGFDESAAVLAELDASDVGVDGPFDADADHARAWLAVGRGELETARTVLCGTAARAAEQGAFAVEAQALYDLARLGAESSVLSRLLELEEVVEGPLVPAQARVVSALVRSDPREAEAASEVLEEIGAVLLAAEAAASTAALWRRAGESRRATLAERRAALLRGRCEAALTPALAGVVTRGALTAREREVARLAAGGLSNREITQRLFLSVRTVENQLQRAYAKLGVRSRTELAAVLRSA
jgi:DNA-binding CsgD family transcriptional regulator